MTLLAVAEALGNQSTMRSCDAHLCFLTMFSKKKTKQFSNKLIKFSDSSGLESHAFRLFPH